MAAGIGADQHLPPQPAGQLGQRQPGHPDVLAGHVRPGVPGPQHDGQRFPAGPGAVAGERPAAGTRTSSSTSRGAGERASTIVASRSTGTSDPSPPGARSPASAHARSRAAVRAARIARSARGASAASAMTSRETTGSEATGPASPDWARSTAISARQSPPSASVVTRSVRIFPGTCCSSWRWRPGACTSSG